MTLNPLFLSPPRISVPRRVSIRLSCNGIPFQPKLLKVEEIQRDVMLLNNTAEVTFVVGGIKVPVHKHLLVRNSPVFATMLGSPLQTGPFIQITDAEAKDFELVMKGLYEGAGVILNRPYSQILRCFMIAHKYNIKSLEIGMYKILLKELCATNVMEVLSSPIVALGVMVELTSKCWSIIEKKTLKSITSPGFLKISWKLLNKLLINSRLTIREYELAKAVVGWCKKQKDNGRTLIEILGIAVYQIRFPLMTSVEFDLIKKMGLLQPGEIEDLTSNFRNNKTYKTVPRRNKCACQTNKVNCPLCSVKWTRRRQCASEKKTSTEYPLTVNFNRDISKKVRPLKPTTTSPSSTTVPPCECQLYLSCPNFPNGQTIKIMRLENIALPTYFR
ncbi:BTB/POZ domain-containing protein 9 isoform X2 [Folsomia candida]|uniref:BTB/POZ domain-containing protein 9 isoform X2 n=1 Tax=Folsomia candida TaxID=158441 RepID=UPI000B90996B|nr:BTB/POZ domain-containing protein 9 isoform X2 [Folsomia candida]